MAQFILYNYQFTRMVCKPEMDLFGETSIQMTAEEAFPMKQEIFNSLFVEDYYNRNKNAERSLMMNSFLKIRRNKEYHGIKFSNRNRNYPHKYLMPPTDDIIILRIANPTKRCLINERFEKEEKFD